MNFSYSSSHLLNKDKFKSLSLGKIKNDNYEKKIDIKDYKSKDINKVKNSVFNNKINYCEIKKVKKDNFIQENISILRKYNELERNYSNLNNDYIEIQNELKNKNQLISDFQKLTENGLTQAIGTQTLTLLNEAGASLDYSLEIVNGIQGQSTKPIPLLFFR